MTFDETVDTEKRPPLPSHVRAPLARLALVDKAVIEVTKAEAGRIRARSTSFADTEKVVPPGCSLVISVVDGRCLVTIREGA